MAVVAGAIFFLFRALLALIPGLRDRASIKKWAAFAALVVTAFYLVLSGNQVATQRSFIMIAVVLIGVMLDRPGIMAQTPQELNPLRRHLCGNPQVNHANHLQSSPATPRR